MLSPVRYLKTRPRLNKWRGQFVRQFEEKLDGHRCTILKYKDEIRAIGRVSYKCNWIYLQRNPQLKELVDALPVNTIIDGELFIPGGTATDVPTVIKTGEGFSFSAFAVPYFDGQDMTMKSLEWARERLQKLEFNVPRIAEFPPGVKEETLYEYARKWGVEGFVGKVHHYDGWFRVKPIETADVVVTGYLEGEGDFKGTLGSLVGSVYHEGKLVEVTRVAKGWDRKSRNLIWLDLSDYIGRVMEVSYDSITKNKKLSFSAFKRWRDDKPPTQCLMDQLDKTKSRKFNGN